MFSKRVQNPETASHYHLLFPQNSSTISQHLIFRILMEKLAYLLLGVAAILWLGLIVKDSVEALPWGLIGLLFIAGVGVLLVKVFKQRLNNSEDDYYSKKVDK